MEKTKRGGKAERRKDDFVIAVILLEEHLSPCQQRGQREEVDKQSDTCIWPVCPLSLSTLSWTHTHTHTHTRTHTQAAVRTWALGYQRPHRADKCPL